MPTLATQEAPLSAAHSRAMSHLLPPRRECASPANLHYLRPRLPVALLKQVASVFQSAKWVRKIDFLPYYRMHLLLALTRGHTLSELASALWDDPLCALTGARLEISVSTLTQLPNRRGCGTCQAVRSHIPGQLAVLPHPTHRVRALTTTTLQSIQERLLTAEIVDSSTFALPPATAIWAKSHADAAGFKLHMGQAAGYGGLARSDLLFASSIAVHRVIEVPLTSSRL